MASPMPSNPIAMGNWLTSSQNESTKPTNTTRNEVNSVPSRPMILKVHYTFDKDSHPHLARWPQVLHIQSFPVDNLQIGLVDLKTCVEAVVIGSPELIVHRDLDFSVYAHDHSEPSSPWVGQGALSNVLNPTAAPHQPTEPRLVTGLVSTSKLPVFGGPAKEILEVKLKLSPLPRPQQQLQQQPQQQQWFNAQPAPMQQPQPQHHQQQQIHNKPSFQQPQYQNQTQQQRIQDWQISLPSDAHQSDIFDEGAPTEPSEWDSFLGNPPNGPQMFTAVDSPVLSVEALDSSATTQSSLPLGSPPVVPPQPSLNDGPMQFQGPRRMEPVLAHKPPKPSSVRSTSTTTTTTTTAKAKTKQQKQPTGRPRGRPRKRQVEGSTSGYEDGTDADDGPPPVKKRALITKTSAGNTISAPFANDPESLRVTASISGSLRNFRPLAPNLDTVAAHHSRDLIPRAPTPVPNRNSLQARARKTSLTTSKLHRQPSLSQAATSPSPSNCGDSTMALSPPADESLSTFLPAALTPNYPDDSPAEMRSSPPLQRALPFIQSSPVPSSPVLPPMPMPPHQDSGFMSGAAVDEVVDGEDDTKKPIATTESACEKRVPRTYQKNKFAVPIDVFMLQNHEGSLDMVHIKSFNKKAPESDNGQAIYMSPFVPLHTDDPVTPGPLLAPALKKAHPDLQPKISRPFSLPPPTSAPVTTTITTAVAATTIAATCPFPPTHPSIEKSLPVQKSAATVVIPDDDDDDVDMIDINALVSTQPNLLIKAQSLPASDAPIVNGSNNSDSIANKSTAPQPSKPIIETTTQTQLQPSKDDAGTSVSVPPPVRATSPSNTPALASTNSLQPAAVIRKSTTVPASDPVEPSRSISLPTMEPTSEAAAPLSPGLGITKLNKNMVKKQAIKQKLAQAISSGAAPTFCNNCGALETPTWRKIWIQDCDGSPPFIEYSIAPGCITAIEITERDAEGKPIKYRTTMKAPGPSTAGRQEVLLCNPCGIWLSKNFQHRPPKMYERDRARLGQERRKRGSNANPPKSKKPRTKGNNNVLPSNLTSEASALTDPLGPVDNLTSPPLGPLSNSLTRSLVQQSLSQPPPPPPPPSQASLPPPPPLSLASSKEGLATHNDQSNPPDMLVAPGSSHSRISKESDKMESFFPLDLPDFSDTCRQLFPTPKNDGPHQALIEMAMNVILPTNELRASKITEVSLQKENNPIKINLNADPLTDADFEDIDALFQSPGSGPIPPCTPPRKTRISLGESSKTPTQATPGRRPVTRSVSRATTSAGSPTSLERQDVQASQKTPIQANRTPGRTPGSCRQKFLAEPDSTSALLRRSPRNHDRGSAGPHLGSPGKSFLDRINASVKKNGSITSQANTDELSESLFDENMDFPSFNEEDFEQYDLRSIFANPEVLDAVVMRAQEVLDAESNQQAATDNNGNKQMEQGADATTKSTPTPEAETTNWMQGDLMMNLVPSVMGLGRDFSLSSMQDLDKIWDASAETQKKKKKQSIQAGKEQQGTTKNKP